VRIAAYSNFPLWTYSVALQNHFDHPFAAGQLKFDVEFALGNAQILADFAALHVVMAKWRALTMGKRGYLLKHQQQIGKTIGILRRVVIAQVEVPKCEVGSLEIVEANLFWPEMNVF
jgi:hypothetical protein